MWAIAADIGYATSTPDAAPEKVAERLNSLQSWVKRAAENREGAVGAFR